jgi:hypothetical protein
MQQLLLAHCFATSYNMQYGRYIHIAPNTLYVFLHALASDV